ncbi:MAG: hypothetical protein CL607_16570 [Anaerolineaceae bacterium]|nr:hypothetical protein [Anaerolineaceae bacterium]
MWLIVRLMAAFLGGVGIARFLKSRRKHVEIPNPEDMIWQPDIPVNIERTAADTALISWTQSAHSVVIYKGEHQQGIDRASPAATVTDSNQAAIGDLDPHIRYDFELVFDDKERTCTSERQIPFEKLANFRDIGGYPTEDGRMVAWDKVYRSVSLAGLTDGDAEKLALLDIQLVCDLRSAEEVDDAPDMLPQSVKTYLHLPAQAEVTRWNRLQWLVFRRHRLHELLQHVYINVMIEQNPQIFAQVFQRLADAENYPVLIHCTAGKDRTGVTVVLLLRLLDVPEQVVIADYTLSNRAYAYIQNLVAKSIRPLTAMGLKEKDVQPLLDANPETIQAMLRHIDREYDGVENYLLHKVGIDSETIDRVKANLIV